MGGSGQTLVLAFPSFLAKSLSAPPILSQGHTSCSPTPSCAAFQGASLLSLAPPPTPADNRWV